MSSVTIPTSPVENWQSVRDEWIAELERMAGDLERWAAESDWDVKRETKEIVEDELGSYMVPVMRIQTMRGRLYFDPICRYVMGASGRIEINATPSFWQAILIKEKGQWRFYDEDFTKTSAARQSRGLFRHCR